METRRSTFEQLFPDSPSFRWQQIEEALFSSARGWEEVTTVPKAMREKLAGMPFMTVTAIDVKVSVKGDTHKALLKVEGGKEIESVLMANRRGAWTICMSSQVGCAMRCGFCATGRMGLTRSLSADEIVDQYRFWQSYVVAPGFSPGSPRLKPGATESHAITNIVFMGMGEPLANYEAVREALNRLLAYTNLGRTHITVSTVGILPRLEQILTDKHWPHVRLAVSLHSAIAATRKQIVHTSYDDFLPKLDDWTRRYLKLHGNRRHHLTFEYVMLRGVNDTPAHAKVLATFVNRIGRIKVNLIPYNLTDCEYQRSTDSTIVAFLDILARNHVTATTRRTMGDDISAACGQLIAEKQAR